MKNKYLIALLPLALASCDKVPVGSVGILVNNLGGDKGVQDEVLPPGWYWVGFSKSLYTFPTYMQNYVWAASAHEGAPHDESITFQTSDGLSVNADVGISYQIDPTKVPVLFQTYRRGLNEITDIYLRNIVRDALVREASTKSIESVYGSGKADLLSAVQKDVASKVATVGIQIDQLSWVGQLRLPETVTNSINAKIQATQIAQQKENEVAATRADAQKAVAKAEGEAKSRLITAEAEAAANKIIAASITKELIQYQSVDKWDGKLPTYSGNAVPFINLDQDK